MQLKAFSGWLLLAPFLVTALAAYTEQEVLANQWDAYLETSEQVAIGTPHHPHHDEPTGSSGTIYQALANDTRFSLITKAVNFVEDIGALLNDSSSTLTFFAPPDTALRRPPGSPPRNLTSFGSPSLTEGDDSSMLTLISQYRDLSELLPLLEELDNQNLSALGDHDDKRKKILKIILRAILSYHILPGTAYDVTELAKNVTYPTQLHIPGAFDGKPLRLRVTRSAIPPATHVNFLSKIVHPDFKATNGIIHVVDHPLLPPPSVFQELYFIPRVFSTLTSALQRSKLTENLDLRYVHGHGLEGTPLVTIFAPTNRAFEALPKKLQLFLFSPFGERVLTKLLQYHIVPNAVIHSNYIHNAGKNVDAHDILPRLPHHREHAEPIFALNLTLDTLFENHTVNAHIVQKEFTFPKFPGPKKPFIVLTNIFVNGHRAILTDVISLNGAIHVVDKLLDPRAHHGKPHHKHPHHGHHHELKVDHNLQFCVDRDHHQGLVFEPIFGGLNDANSISTTGPRGHPGPACPCVYEGRGKGSSKNRHEGKHDEHKLEEAEAIHDIWADWESWLPQWAEQQD